MPEDITDYIVRSQLPPIDYPNIAVGQYFAQEFAKYDQNSVALIDPITDEKVTFGQLHDRAQFVASALLDLGIAASDVSLYYGDNSLQYMISVFASIYLNVPQVNVAPANGAFELAQQIIDSSSSVLVFSANKLPTVMQVINHEDFGKAFDQIRIVLVLTGNGDNTLDSVFVNHSAVVGKKIITFNQALQAGNERRLPCIPHFPIKNLSQDHFMITFTSGTTGKPKAAVHSHRSYLTWLVNLRFKEPLAGKIYAIANPLGHISGFCYSHTALLDGMAVALFNSPTVDQMMAAVERYRISHMVFGANNATDIANGDYPERYDLSSLELMKFGSSKVAANLLVKIKQRYRVRMYEVYGSTEFWGHLEYRDYRQLDEWYQPHSLGAVVPGVEMKVLDLKSGKSLPENEHGEICFRGPQCFIGYLNNEEATRNTVDADGWYHSGDVGYYDANGNLFTSDRIKEMIKYKMWSMAPAEIEDFLHRHPAVAAVCVVGVPHATDGALVRAYVMRKAGKEVTEQELIDYVKENMGFQKRLRGGVRFIPEMVRTPVGKIDRKYFKQLVKDELITEQIE